MLNGFSPYKCLSTIYKTMSTLLIAFVITQIGIAPATSQSVQKIVALVNDEPISAFDVDQRIRFLLLNSKELRNQLQNTLKAQSTQDRFRQAMISAQPKSKEEALQVRNRFLQRLRSEVTNSMRSKFRKQALEQLIDERLMIQDAKKANIAIDDIELDEIVSNMASRNKSRQTGKPMSSKEFLGGLKRAGVSETAYKERLRANVSFQRLVQRKYGRNLFVGEQRVDELLAAEASGSEAAKSVEFQLQKISLSIPKNANQTIIAQRLVDADKVRSLFKSCAESKKLSQNIEGLRVQSLGTRTAKQISQPARSYLLEAKAGELTPPDMTPNGIELYAVCSKRNVSADKDKRREVQNKLRQQEIAVLRKRHLRNLRQDAFVEYR